MRGATGYNEGNHIERFRRAGAQTAVLADRAAACRLADKIGRYKMFTKDIGIDLGTANTLVYLRGKGIIMREPSVVAVDVRTDAVVEVGSKAKDMIGRTPGSIVAVSPLKDGVIADFDITATMLKHFIREALRVAGRFSKANVIICIPSGVTEVERQAVKDAAYKAGAQRIELVDEPMAAAMGADLPVQEPRGSMVLDIGGGTSEVAVISLGDIVAYKSVRVAGNKFDEAIIQYIKHKYDLLIGEQTAEEIKVKIGSAYPTDETANAALQVKGRSLVDGLAKNITITSEEVREALSDSLQLILDAVRATLERTPPELAADIIDYGLTLTGGGALLRGLAQLMHQETGLPVHVAKNPLECVARGAGKKLEEIDLSARPAPAEEEEADGQEA